MRQETRQEIALTLADLLNLILRSPLSVLGTEDLARQCGYSRSHLTRVFQEMCGESLGVLHRRIRMERAAYALQRGLSVRDASEMGGFDSPEAFSRAFRTAYGLTPREFARGEQTWKLPSPDGLHWNEHWDESFEAPGLRVKYETVVERGAPFRIAAIRHVRNYGSLSEAWEKIPFVPDRQWVTIYRDNLWTCPNKHLMRSDLGYVLGASEKPRATFRLIEIPGHLRVKTNRYIKRTDRNEAWSYLSGAWPDSLLSWDEYEAWPLPFEDVMTRACLAFQ